MKPINPDLWHALEGARWQYSMAKRQDTPLERGQFLIVLADALDYAAKLARGEAERLADMEGN